MKILVITIIQKNGKREKRRIKNAKSILQCVFRPLDRSCPFILLTTNEICLHNYSLKYSANGIY